MSEVRDPFADGDEASRLVWGRLAHPYDLAMVLEAFLGLPGDAAIQLAGVMVAGSEVADRLLAEMPRLVRQLQTSVGASLERCQGELRGPIYWSETMSARASTFGQEDLFVCAVAQRQYDTKPNRVLKATLDAISRAGAAVASIDESAYDDAILRRARRNGREAARYVEHKALSGLPVERPATRDLRRTANGRSAQRYRLALDVYRELLEGISVDELTPFLDERTRAQHALFLAVVERLEAEGVTLPAIRADRGTLYCGRVAFRHPRQRGDRRRIHGVLIGEVLVDVPERLRDRSRARAQRGLEARAGGRPAVAVCGAEDVEAAVAMAAEHDRRRLAVAASA